MSTTATLPASKRRSFSAHGPGGGYSGGKAESIKVSDDLLILDDGQEAPKGYCVFKICTIEDGDQRIAWNPHRIQEINEAKALFNKLIGEGYFAYKIDPNNGGRGSTLIRRFEDIIGEGELMMSEIRPPKEEGRPLKKAAGAENMSKAPEVVMHPRPQGG